MLIWIRNFTLLAKYKGFLEKFPNKQKLIIISTLYLKHWIHFFQEWINPPISFKKQKALILKYTEVCWNILTPIQPMIIDVQVYYALDHFPIIDNMSSFEKWNKELQKSKDFGNLWLSPIQIRKY